MTQLTLDQAVAAGREAMQAVEAHAGEAFREQARAFVLLYLKHYGPTSGEDITEACIAEGIKPHDQRAFGSIYFYLARNGLIEKCGSVPRRKGHGTAGGTVWRLTKEGA